MEPFGCFRADFSVITPTVVLTNRAEHDRCRQVAVERLVNANEMLRHEAAEDVGDLEVMLAHSALIEHDAPHVGRSTISLRPATPSMPLSDPRVLVTTGCNAALEQGPHVLGVEQLFGFEIEIGSESASQRGDNFELRIK